MSNFAQGVPRVVILLGAVLGLCLVPPELLDKGPNLCLWRHLFHLAACPSCGSTRALAAFFHGRFHQALGYNRNVVVTAPALLGLLVQDLAALAGTIRHPLKRHSLEKQRS
ncbi:MAG TPA: DUF2752 domain-containing protein [Terriglobia bacterium]|nr:DUF2752 domain-containing protein [Terriglobia bacterium]